MNSYLSQKTNFKFSVGCLKIFILLYYFIILFFFNRLLVLDELDQLESRKQSVLYSVFEWPSLKNSRLVLVGIANALDLTDRVLPRLQARIQLKPQLLHFPPYTRQQIVEIITKRLNEVS